MASTVSIDLVGLPAIYNLTYPVGPGCANVIDDVLLVQTLMKLAHFSRTHPGLGPVEHSSSITIDGAFGPQTERMIKAFEASQRSAGKLLIDDGVVEPSSKDGYTSRGILYKIVLLNRRAHEASTGEFNVLPTDPGTHAILRGSLARGRTRERPLYTTT